MGEARGQLEDFPDAAGPETDPRLEKLRRRAEQDGFHLFTDWDVARILDIVREQRRRNARQPYVIHLEHHAREIRASLRTMDATPFGEKVLFLGAFLQCLAQEGAKAIDLCSMLQMVGADLLEEAGQ